MVEFLHHASELRNIYYRIRAIRSVNARRRWYRLAQKEKAKLKHLGYHAEVIRLYALYLKDTTRQSRHSRFVQSFHEHRNAPIQLELF